MAAQRSLRVATVAALVLLGVRLDAHDGGHSVLTLDARGVSGAVSGVLQIPVEDIEPLVNLDANGDFAVSQAELDNKSKFVRAIVSDSLGFEDSSAACTLRLEDLRSVALESRPHVSIRLSAECAGGGKLKVWTRLFFGHSAYSVLLSATNAHGAFD